MIKLVAFDWNGTLLSDTGPVISAENAVRKFFGLRSTDLKQFRNEYDIPIKKYWVATGFDSEMFDKEADNIQKVFMATFEPLDKKSRIRSGAREVLICLKEKNILACVFSNHPQDLLEKKSEKLKFQNFFSTILGREEGNNSHMLRRGKEEKLVDYINSLKLNPEEVVTVGDTVEEIDIARKHGYISIAITGGYNSTKRLKAAKPDYLISNLAEVKEIIENINNGRITSRN